MRSACIRASGVEVCSRLVAVIQTFYLIARTLSFTNGTTLGCVATVPSKWTSAINQERVSILLWRCIQTMMKRSWTLDADARAGIKGFRWAQSPRLC